MTSRQIEGPFDATAVDLVGAKAFEFTRGDGRAGEVHADALPADLYLPLDVGGGWRDLHHHLNEHYEGGYLFRDAWSCTHS